MNHETLGWIEIIGGVLALLTSGRVGYGGMMGMMGYGEYNMMAYGSGIAVSLLALVIIISGVQHLTEKKHNR